MSINENSVVGQMVAANYKTADVFKKHGIDFCCGGNITISEAAEKYKAETKALLADLETVTTKKDMESELLQKLTPDALIDHIIEQHHSFVRENIESIPPYLEKLADVHGANHPELIQVYQLFMGAATALSQHLEAEEQILFPYIKELVKAQQKGEAPLKSQFGSVENPISNMHSDHDAEGERFRTISELTNGYQLPPDGCNTYRVGLAKLEAFETDLHRHIHLENNILFPKAVELEKKLVI